MKNIITFALLLTVISFSSCSKKKNIAPETTTGTVTTTSENKKINVQYRVSCTSGQMNVEYVTVEDGVATTKTTSVSRYTFSYTFDWTKGQNLSVKAYNSAPANKEVVVEIYVDGELFKSGKANLAGSIASAEGVFN